MTSYDIIGDIHGHAEELRHLLLKLGYQRSGYSQSKSGASMSLGLRLVIMAYFIVVSNYVTAEEPAENAIEHKLAGELVLIPAGDFMMGSSEEVPGASQAEFPRHRVQIKSPFYMGIHEVTFGQFRRFVSDTGYVTDAEKDGVGGWGYSSDSRRLERSPEKYSWRNTGWKQSQNHPVVNVSWSDAAAYCRWLTKEDQTFRFRMPTEAEWEYACRSGTETAWNVGDDPKVLQGNGNINDLSSRRVFAATEGQFRAAEKWDDGYEFTSKVGSYSPNSFGLFDMHGNAGEWCADIFDKDRYLKADDFMAVLGQDRIHRGGSWSHHAANSRSAKRHRRKPSESLCNLGFRIVRETIPLTQSPERKLVLVPLYRFYDSTLREHLYAYGVGEPPVLRKRPEVTGETIIGYVSLREEARTSRIWRYRMPDGRHYFLHYVKDANSPVEVGAELRANLETKAVIEPFEVWGWDGRSDQRLVPVYACSLPDGTDMLFSRDPEEIRRAIRDTWNSRGIKRLDHRVAFYVYPESVSE